MGGLWRAYQRLAAPVGLVLLGLAVARLGLMAHEAAGLPGALGVDWHCNANAARSWLAGDGYFLDRQLHGPYVAQTATAQDLGEVLYPPVALYLFVPFTFLPDIAWWIVPAILTAAALWRLRPGPAAWPVMGMLATLSVNVIVAGNPAIWLVPAALWGLLLGWPGVLVLLKPSALPLALAGITHRSWWLALGVLVLVSIPFGYLWVQWVQVIVDQRGSGLFYSYVQWPLLAIPLVAWLSKLQVGQRPGDPTLTSSRDARLRRNP